MKSRARRPVVFLGCAHPHADGRANRVKKLAGWELAGAFDDDAKVAAAFAARQQTSVQASAAAAIGAARGGLVIIETWNARAAELAHEVIDAGVPLLLEKPGAHEPRALRELAAYAKRKQAWVQVGYHMRYGPTVAPALAIVRSGALGTITTGRFHSAVQKPWLTNEWFCDKKDMGGLVFLDACHVLDLLFWFLGAPSEVVCRTKTLPHLEGNAGHPFEDSGALIVTIGDALFAGDVCGWETNDWVDTWDLQLYGTEGTLVLGLHPPRLRVWSPKEPKSTKQAGAIARGWTDVHHESFNGEENYERELQDVVARLKKGQPPGGCTLDQAVVVIDAIEQAYASANGKAAKPGRGAARSGRG